MATEEEKIALGKSIKEKRLKLGISQTQLAQVCNVEQQRITLWERGKYQPYAIEYIKMLKFFKSKES